MVSSLEYSALNTVECLVALESSLCKFIQLLYFNLLLSRLHGCGLCGWDGNFFISLMMFPSSSLRKSSSCYCVGPFTKPNQIIKWAFLCTCMK
ncbi:hypothetical protein HanXRQr2_Chr05g0231841 [Helianthus annuus]|uniref:Uncharacterized protein n=1 Tax=Helianthus annuus TaxID=4232 RepID=A0A9K3J3S1_HELAN|nr:hypothetical protein HanXRQr2_Chr05g0231841 [Helianthus annuus]KAJ0924040.1 hypothetical protein HanPSC8_Chr05g0223641 [Helianthus annuus]